MNGVDVSSVSNGTCTFNTTYTRTNANSGCRWTKYGRVVILLVDEVCPKAAATQANTMATGIPQIASGTVQIGTIGTYGVTSATGGFSYRVSISGSEIRWHWSGGNNDSCTRATGQIVYIYAS